MKDAFKIILGCFDDNPRRATLELVSTGVICAIVMGFLLWYAVPIPSDIPEYPRLSEAVREATR